jgi:pathogenesis-related protein 1
MSCRSLFSACLIGTGILAAAGDVQAQEIELKSVQLRVLGGTEQQQFLAAHNAARKAVDVDTLSWSEDLSKYALESLEQQKDALIQAAKEGWEEGRAALPEHRADAKYGENLAAWAGSKPRPAELAVQLWLSEKAAFTKLNAEGSYRIGDEEGQTEIDDKGQERPIVVGHYTAVVWRATKEIGAAKLEFELTDGDTSRTFAAIICNYNPPGNRRGDKPF